MNRARRPVRPLHWRVLAHQPRAAAHRCIQVPLGRFRLALCSRCCGVYPVLFAGLFVQLHWWWPKPGPADWWIGLVLAAPGLLDWGSGQLGRPGSNAQRIASGALLGVALARTLSLYLRDPLNEVFWVQALLLAVGTGAFVVVRRCDIGAGDSARAELS